MNTTYQYHWQYFIVRPFIPKLFLMELYLLRAMPSRSIPLQLYNLVIPVFYKHAFDWFCVLTSPTVCLFTWKVLQRAHPHFTGQTPPYSHMAADFHPGSCSDLSSWPVTHAISFSKRMFWILFWNNPPNKSYEVNDSWVCPEHLLFTQTWLTRLTSLRDVLPFIHLLAQVWSVHLSASPLPLVYLILPTSSF